jgi:uncharacterized protein YjbJ (UPF0337 family)
MAESHNEDASGKLGQQPCHSVLSEQGETFPVNGRFHRNKWRIQMDKDRIKGSAEQVKGKTKEVAGKVTGDSKLKSEGKASQVKGKMQNTIGGIKDSLRGK